MFVLVSDHCFLFITCYYFLSGIPCSTAIRFIICTQIFCMGNDFGSTFQNDSLQDSQPSAEFTLKMSICDPNIRADRRRVGLHT